VKLQLVMVKPDGTSKELSFDRSEILIGRDEGSKLRIPLAGVSRKHCQILEEDDELIIRDLGSSNGTFVNGMKIRETELSPGDLLNIGGVVFVVRIDGFPATIDVKDSYAAGIVTDGIDDDDDDFLPPAKPASSNSPTAIGPGGARPLSPRGGKSDDLSDLLKDLEDDDDVKR
jgi:pSer/pThr/pTyr-binding forkhead associated (FHA) protein